MHPAEQIAIIIGRIYRSEMTTTSGGNLSIMDENGDMWITPAAIDKGSLTPADIMCVKADGTIIGPHRPSSEYPFHKAIYKMNPHIHSVIHAHPPGLVTFSMVHQVPDTSIILRRARPAALSDSLNMPSLEASFWERKLWQNSRRTRTTRPSSWRTTVSWLPVRTSLMLTRGLRPWSSARAQS